MPELSFCAWEQAFSQGGASLQRAVGDVLETSGVGNLFRHCRRVALQRRATAGGTTPSQHPYVAHITRDHHAHGQRSQDDARGTRQSAVHGPGDRHEADPGHAFPVFMGTGGRTAKWTLKEIITCLGVKKVGAIAQLLLPAGRSRSR